MFIFLWFLFAIFVGVYASSYCERTGFGWFLLGLFISPLLAFIILLAIGKNKDAFKKCPQCAETIKSEAKICKFCHSEQTVVFKKPSKWDNF